MIDPRLLVPLSALPGPVPVGAPLVVEWATGPSPAVLLRDGGGEQVCVAVEIGVGWQADPPKPPRRLCWLDLAPPDPPLSRVDGLDVARAILCHDLPQAAALTLISDDDEQPMALRLAVAAILRAGGAR
jgi:hypothetical protein